MGKKIGALVTDKFDKVLEGESIYDAIKKIAVNRETSIACVVDGENKLKGLLTPRNILETLEVRELGVVRGRFFAGPEILHLLTSKYAKDIMSAPVSVKVNDEIEQVINLMLDEGFYELPVVDEDVKVVGTINYFDIILSSLKELKD